MPKTKITATVEGRKVEKEAPFANPSVDVDLVSQVMSVAKVSEEDAQWLLKDGYWGRIMHMVRSAVVMRHAALEEPEDNAL